MFIHLLCTDKLLSYQYVAASMMSATWVILWQILRINPARQAAGIPYPQR
jgi:hypothetical protein